jgi:hypothetical protein
MLALGCEAGAGAVVAGLAVESMSLKSSSAESDPQRMQRAAAEI